MSDLPERSAADALPRWLPLALLALSVAVLFHRLLLGEVLFWGLPALQFYPWREFAMSELAQGRLPLWNPYNGAGAPLLANYQSALLYPPHLLYFLNAGPQMMGILGLMHILWAGLGMWFLTGRFGLPTLGRGIAVLAYPLSTTLVARFGTLPMVDCAAWLPWLMLAGDALVARPGPWQALALAVATAMQLLAGHAQWTFYSLALAGAYMAWRVATERRPARTLAVGVAAVLLGAGVAAAQLFPTAELQQQSQRVERLDEDFALNFSFSPISLVTLFNPDFFGNPGNGTYAIGGAYFETTAYIGFLPAALALVGTLGQFRRWWRRRGSAAQVAARATESVYGRAERRGLALFFALVVLVSLILAFGKFFPVYPFLYRSVPTFNLFQAPARWLLLTVFALALLAALAVPELQAGYRAQRRLMIGMMVALVVLTAGLVSQAVLVGGSAITQRMMFGMSVIGALWIASALILAGQPADSPRRWSAWAAGVLVFVAADLVWVNWLSNPTIPASFYERPSAVRRVSGRLFWADAELQKVQFTDFLPFRNYQVALEQRDTFRASDLPDLNLLDRAPTLNNFDPLRVDGVERYIRLLNRAPTPALLQAAGVGAARGLNVTLLPEKRVWLVPAVAAVNSPEEAEKAITAAGWDPARLAAIEGALNLPAGAAGGTASITAENPTDLTISVESAGGGLLVLADAYYPGWEATLDGGLAQIYRTNVAFRGVAVPAGRHLVHMTYASRWLAWGFALSAGSLAACVWLLVLGALRRRVESG